MPFDSIKVRSAVICSNFNSLVISIFCLAFVNMLKSMSLVKWKQKKKPCARVLFNFIEVKVDENKFLYIWHVFIIKYIYENIISCLLCVIFWFLWRKIKTGMCAPYFFPVNCSRCNRGRTLTLFGMRYVVPGNVSVCRDAENKR